ncbi:ATP-binding protein [Roseofilum reptotaenium CS-1145]|uniref:histidine kinase n=1 Tax=Roseofilum reptotaenium AO1-A TaxID=1925591 RepID=A0A1L9QTQ1_9CYAN|nr:ATP-binding protein [Roseofilum reptotaenium]MDB9519040.1 ATP-binding protein [Roseofilum reptotaenium CS-1145]OJJ26043.1 cyclic nucleotide-binding protein [Roseofilum reptotaenium AO1-A]
MNLESHPFISYFEPDQVAQLCDLADMIEFDQPTVIFEEGEVPDGLYLVLAGQVEFSKMIDTEKYQTIALAKENDFFGEFGVLDGKPRSARATAAEGSILAKIPQDKLMDILQNSKGEVILALFRHIIHHIRITTTQYVNQIVHKQKMVLVGEMVNTIIHDFKSPFNGIQLSSSMLQEMHSDEETQEWCDLIQAQITRMLGMAEEVLEFSKGHATLYRQPIQLSDLLKQFEKLNRIYLHSAQVEWVVQIEPVEIYADFNKLLRVLQNIITNAVEAFEGKGGRIEVTAKSQAECVAIQIRDNGPGIPKAIQEDFFEAFVTHGKRGGTGLGTAIAKSIIDAHQGQISFESEEQQGTTFTIRLPR